MIPDHKDAIILVDKLPFRRAAMIAFLRPWALQRGMRIIAHGEPEPQAVRMVIVIAGFGVEEVPTEYLGQTVVILSANDSLTCMKEAWHNNINSYILKSLEPHLVTSALDLVLAGGRYYPPALLGPIEVDPKINLDGFTPRQREILECIKRGEPNKIIARRLNISEATVKIHVRHIMRRMGVNNRTKVALMSLPPPPDSSACNPAMGA